MLGDYKRLVEAPMIRDYEDQIAALRAEIERLTTPSPRLDAATVERRRKALREALEHVDSIAGEMNGVAERAHLIDADDAAMNLADAYGVEFAPGWEDEVAALATDPHQHGGKGA